MEKILITGASGFIGRRVAPELLKQYSREQLSCLVYDRDTPHEIAGRKVLDANGLTYTRIDLLEPSSLKNLSKGYTTIVHLAASTDTSTNDFSSNDIGTKNLLEALGPLTPETHFIYFSSAAVYTGRHDLSQPVTHDTKPHPTNEYGRSKLRAEEVMIARAAQEGFRLTIVRTNTVYGPVPRVNSLLDVLKQQVLQGSLATRLNWPGRVGIVHVDDVSKKVFDLVTSPAKAPKLELLIFSTESIPLTAMYEPICKILGKPYRVWPVPRGLWALASYVLQWSYVLEPVLPERLYNLFWRASLIAGDVLRAETTDVEVGGTKLRLFADAIGEIIVSEG